VLLTSSIRLGSILDTPSPVREICHYGRPQVRFRRIGGLAEGFAVMKKQGIAHTPKRTRPLHYQVTSLINLLILTPSPFSPSRHTRDLHPSRRSFSSSCCATLAAAPKPPHSNPRDGSNCYRCRCCRSR
jgi:hypothetical protein